MMRNAPPIDPTHKNERLPARIHLASPRITACRSMTRCALPHMDSPRPDPSSDGADERRQLKVGSSIRYTNKDARLRLSDIRARLLLDLEASVILSLCNKCDLCPCQLNYNFRW